MDVNNMKVSNSLQNIYLIEDNCLIIQKGNRFEERAEIARSFHCRQ